MPYCGPLRKCGGLFYFQVEAGTIRHCRMDEGSTPHWIAECPSFDAAQQQMRQLALEKPGHYFIWDWANRIVVDNLDTIRE